MAAAMTAAVAVAAAMAAAMTAAVAVAVAMAPAMPDAAISVDHRESRESNITEGNRADSLIAPQLRVQCTRSCGAMQSWAQQDFPWLCRPTIDIIDSRTTVNGLVRSL